MGSPDYVLEVEGDCPVCGERVWFRARYDWLRDHLLCSNCGSMPRERALMAVLRDHYPDYQNLKIHESSPGGAGASLALSNTVAAYSSSHFFPDKETGTIDGVTGIRNENLEALTFEDESFDLFISQDVMEHIFNPSKAFKEIARVLRKGGAHIFTVPMINKARPTAVKAELAPSGEIIYHGEPEYHGNPIDAKGSLVTMHWGFDIARFIQLHSGLHTSIFYIDDLTRGIRAEFIEVLISWRT